MQLTNARIFDGRQMLPGTHDVRVDGAVIAAIDDRSGPESDDAIDVGGMTLMPGLITCHLHPDFYKFDVFAGEKPGKELPPGVMMAIGVRTCRVLLESGFTGYVGAACAHDIDASLKMAIAQDIIPGPRIRACGHHLGTTGDMNNRSRWWKPYTTPGLDLLADGPDALRMLVRDEIRRGVETIKVMASVGHGIPGKTTRNIARDELEAIVNAAHERGAKVRAHVADKEMMLECIELGVDILDHGDEIDDECIEKMLEAETFWVPSLVYLWSLFEIGYAEQFGVTRAIYDHVREMLPVAQAAGVRILAGDDYSGIFRTMIEDDPLDHQVGNYGREFAYYGEIDGLDPADILSWGTSNAGQLLVDPPATVGVIEPGAMADLIVVDGDPVADLSLLARPNDALKAVIRDGTVTIDRLPPRANRAAAYVSDSEAEERKVVFVTGAGSGIGRAAAEAFALRGYATALADMNEDAGQEVEAELRRFGECTFFRCDVTDDDTVREAIGQTVAAYGRLDAAFNAAGIDGEHGKLTAEGTMENWNRVIAVDLTGTWSCLRYELPEIVKAGGGSIVNCASVAGLRGAATVSAYTAAKHGVVGLTKVAAREYASAGVRVNAICPGMVDMPMFRRGMTPDLVTQFTVANPSGRLAEAREIAETALWLCADAPGYITGQAIAVDGGAGA